MNRELTLHAARELAAAMPPGTAMLGDIRLHGQRGHWTAMSLAADDLRRVHRVRIDIPEAHRSLPPGDLLDIARVAAQAQRRRHGGYTHFVALTYLAQLGVVGDAADDLLDAAGWAAPHLYRGLLRPHQRQQLESIAAQFEGVAR